MAEGWSSVKSETIVKCFRKCGVLLSESCLLARVGSSEDPFDDVDEMCQLRALVDSTCSPGEYVTGDNSLPMSDDTGDDWNELSSFNFPRTA